MARALPDCVDTVVIGEWFHKSTMRQGRPRHSLHLMPRSGFGVIHGSPLTDTCIVGNGPAALILSYILHGHIPYYIGGHHDPILDSKLGERSNLLDLKPDLYAHFLSSLRYSTQSLPVNTLLDTLLRPNADTEISPKSCIEWRYEPERAISHICVGQAPQTGGQWAEPSTSANADIGTLSYAEQLSLPGYSYADHLARKHKDEQYEFVRPSRTDLADYLRTYPEAVGIADAFHNGIKAEDVHRTRKGFEIGSLGVRCKHLVLASGIFTVNIPPPPLLAPIADLDARDEPLLVIGSGFSAADVVISTPPTRKITHIFQWSPETRPSPLKGCHHSAYPEYATVYRQMKLAALSSSKKRTPRSPLLLRRKSNAFSVQRDWASVYEGLPNAKIVSVSPASQMGTVTVTIRLNSGETITRTVGGLQYLVGRRGSLDYLSPELQAEILGPLELETQDGHHLISGRTLRPKAEVSLEVARNVFIAGSLAGDSLIRHAIGGCVYVAGRITGHISSMYSPVPSPTPSPVPSPCASSPTQAAHPGTGTSLGEYLQLPSSTFPLSPSSESGIFTTAPTTPAALELFSTPMTEHTLSFPAVKPATPPTPPRAGDLSNGHEDLHLDRRKLAQAHAQALNTARATAIAKKAAEVANVENRVWEESGWWAGGPVGGPVGNLNIDRRTGVVGVGSEEGVEEHMGR